MGLNSSTVLISSKPIDFGKSSWYWVLLRPLDIPAGTMAPMVIYTENKRNVNEGVSCSCDKSILKVSPFCLFMEEMGGRIPGRRRPGVVPRGLFISFLNCGLGQGVNYHVGVTFCCILMILLPGIAVPLKL